MADRRLGENGMIQTYITDPVNKGVSHAYFNASFLRSLSGRNEYLFLGERMHTDILKSLVPEINSISIKGGSSTKRKITTMWQLLKKTMFRKSYIYILAADNTVIPLILLFFYPFLFKCNITIVLHNNIPTLAGNKWKRLLHKFLYRIYNLESILLTQTMYDTYARLFPDGKFSFIPHPNYLSLIKFNKKCLPEVVDKINILLMGRQAKLMLRSLESLNIETLINLNFIIVGQRHHADFKTNICSIDRKVDFDEYYSLLSEADFVLFADDQSVFSRASGILIDAITFKCPIIAPNGGHFLEFSKFDIGYLYQNRTQMFEILEEINRTLKNRKDFELGFDLAQNHTNITNWNRIVNRIHQ